MRAPVYLDLTHLGRHVTGLERIAIELFETADFDHADMRPVRSSGLISMVVRQQILLPLLAIRHPTAQFVFPGFPPSVLFPLWRERTVLYVHDAFLLTRPQDLNRKAKLYMAGPFRRALKRLRYFLVNSEKTRAEIAPFLAPDAIVGLYRPGVRNVFALDASARRSRSRAPGPLRLVALGTVEPRKNYAAAAAILNHMRARGHPDAELHIIGRPGWGAAYERIASEPGVTIHGYLPSSEVKSLLEQADAYLCTSHDEGLGLPLLEAQYAGLPIIAPDRPVFREVLAASGWYIDPNAPAEAAGLILARLRESDARRRAAHLAIQNLDRWNALAAADRSHVRHLFSAAFAQSMARSTPAS